MKWNTIKPDVLTVWTYSAFAPVCFVKDGKPAGKDISFLKKFAADHQMKVEFTAQPEFKGIWQKPGKGWCDIAAAGISPWKARKDESPGVVWSKDYFHVQRSLLIRERDKDTFRTIEDFEHKTIGVTESSSADIDTQARKPRNTKTKPFADQAVAVAELLAGSIDAFAEGDVSNLYLAIHKPLVVTDVHEMDPKNPEAFSFPVRQDSGIVDALNTWIAARQKDEYLNIDV
jgi:ABC-type amino acid transport substrate-binding protein